MDPLNEWSQPFLVGCVTVTSCEKSHPTENFIDQFMINSMFAGDKSTMLTIFVGYSKFQRHPFQGSAAQNLC